MDSVGWGAEEWIATACFVVGVGILLLGAWHGYETSKAAPAAAKKVEDAKTEVADAKVMVRSARADLRNVRADDTGGTQATATAATTAASEAVEKADSALSEVAGIVGSLPEPLRFSGLLVLVGALLMSIATIQFGGTPIF